MDNPKILIAAGGSGGHIFPGLAIAEKLFLKGWQISWVGTSKRLEAKIVPDYEYKFYSIDITGLRNKNILSLFNAPWMLLKAVWQSYKILKIAKPDLVLTMGGFVSGPVAIAAWLKRIPICMHEQNIVPGFTNRCIFPLAKVVMTAFPNVFTGKKVILTGNPVRSNLTKIVEPKSRYASRNDPIRILILGGSQGAQIFNKILPKALANLSKAHACEIWHQTGLAEHIETSLRYSEINIKANVEPFIKDMPKAYSWADLIIARSGALTVAEICTVGVAALLIPYPYAVDDHQTKNITQLVEAKALRFMRQNEITLESLQQTLTELCADRVSLTEMAIMIKKFSHALAADKAARACQEVVSN